MFASNTYPSLGANLNMVDVTIQEESILYCLRVQLMNEGLHNLLNVARFG